MCSWHTKRHIFGARSRGHSARSRGHALNANFNMFQQMRHCHLSEEHEQSSACVAALLGKEGNTWTRFPGNLTKMPGLSRDNPVKLPIPVLVCIDVWEQLRALPGQTHKIQTWHWGDSDNYIVFGSGGLQTFTMFGLKLVQNVCWPTLIHIVCSRTSGETLVIEDQATSCQLRVAQAKACNITQERECVFVRLSWGGAGKSSFCRFLNVFGHPHTLERFT